MIRGAGAVTAGNRHLAEWASSRHPKVSIVPTAIDLAAFAASGPSPVPVIGWIGTRSNLMYLRTVLPALAALERQRPGIRLKVVCDEALDHPGLAVENKPWALLDEPSELRSFQIGIMPLPDDAWTRGKCGGKLLQYFAAGLPVVCSPVGANRDIVEPGVSGLFATTTDEWCAALCRLIDDAPLRQRLGAAGRDRVEREYSLAGTFPKLLAAIA